MNKAYSRKICQYYKYYTFFQIYLTPDTPIHKDIYELMKTRSDARFVWEVAQTMWGTEGLQQRCLNVERANARNNGEIR